MNLITEFVKVWEKVHKNRSKNGIYKIKKEAYYEMKGK